MSTEKLHSFDAFFKMYVKAEKEFLLWEKKNGKSCLKNKKDKAVPLSPAELEIIEWRKLFRDKVVGDVCIATEVFMCKAYAFFSAFKAGLYAKYEIELTVEQLASMAFGRMYEGGVWSRLQAYDGECSFFSWLKLCCKQVIFAELEKEGYFKSGSSNGGSRFVLNLEALTDREERRLLIDLVHIPMAHTLLVRLYMDEVDEDILMKEMGLGKSQWAQRKKDVIKLFKEVLLDRGDYFIRREPQTKAQIKANEGKVVDLIALVLRDNGSKEQSVSADDFDKAALKVVSDEPEETDGWERFPLLHKSGIADVHELVRVELAKLDLKEPDKYIWEHCFALGESGEQVAAHFGQKRSWVYNRYKRVKDKLLARIVKDFQLPRPEETAKAEATQKSESARGKKHTTSSEETKTPRNPRNSKSADNEKAA